MPVKKGDAFLIPSGPTNHLCCILTDKLPGSFRLFVTITSIYPDKHFDDACVLNVGDHPSILHPSYVAYRHIDQRTEQHIENMIAANEYIRRDPFAENVLERILKGAQISDEIKPHAAAML